MAFEGVAERERVVVADRAGDARDAAPGVVELVGSEVETPRVRYVNGGSPTTSVKRRAKAARDNPTLDASPATVQRFAGLLCISSSAGPSTGSAAAAYHGGSARRAG